MLVDKKGQKQPRLTFNYNWVFEHLLGNHMELLDRSHDFLSNPRHRVFCHFDVKHAY